MASVLKKGFVKNKVQIPLNIINLGHLFFVIPINKCTIFIYNILYILNASTCFNTSASFSDSLNLVLAKVTKLLTLLKLQINKTAEKNVIVF